MQAPLQLVSQTPDPVEPEQSFVGSYQRVWMGWVAIGWYLSVLFHLLCYAVAAGVFAWLAIPHFLPTTLNPVLINAALDDQQANTDSFPPLQVMSMGQPGQGQSETALEEVAARLAISDRGQIETLASDARIAAAGAPQLETTESDQNFFRIPDSGLAVTRGSFTAWADPPDPQPGEAYQLIIEIRLPDDVKTYQLLDLSGRVVGSDGYLQRLPYDSRPRWRSATRVTGGAKPAVVRRHKTRVKITGSKLQLAIKVEGAQKRLTKDTIQIRSSRLKEEHELTLVFGVPHSGNLPSN
jgi:hypothetical protein